eukprot:CFRG5913T1
MIVGYAKGCVPRKISRLTSVGSIDISTRGELPLKGNYISHFERNRHERLCIRWAHFGAQCGSKHESTSKSARNASPHCRPLGESQTDTFRNPMTRHILLTTRRSFVTKSDVCASVDLASQNLLEIERTSQTSGNVSYGNTENPSRRWSFADLEPETDGLDMRIGQSLRALANSLDNKECSPVLTFAGPLEVDDTADEIKDAGDTNALTTKDTSTRRQSNDNLPSTTHTLSVVRSYTTEHAEQVISCHIMPKLPHVIGFDIEWVPSGNPNPTPSLLQISVQDTVFLFHIAYFKSIPPALKKLLWNPLILKAGHGISADAFKLYHSYGLRTCGMVEICNIGKNLSVPKSFGLAKVALATSNLVLKKSKRVTMSNWGIAALTPKQVHYAAQDAWIGAVVLDRLYRVHRKTNHQSLYEFVVLTKGLSGPTNSNTIPLGMNHFLGHDKSAMKFEPMAFLSPATPSNLELSIDVSPLSEIKQPLKKPQYLAKKTKTKIKL